MLSICCFMERQRSGSVKEGEGVNKDQLIDDQRNSLKNLYSDSFYLLLAFFQEFFQGGGKIYCYASFYCFAKFSIRPNFRGQKSLRGNCLSSLPVEESQIRKTG